MKEYYYVEGLKELYAESYDLIPDKYNDLKDRGYDIIDKVEIGGVLFVGINPSYDENRQGADVSIVRKSDAVGDSDGYNYEPYFGKPKQLCERLGAGGFSHVDMFSIRCRQQFRVRNMVHDPACKAFVDIQLGLFRKIVDDSLPIPLYSAFCTAKNRHRPVGKIRICKNAVNRNY